MADFAVTVRKIRDIRKHPNADRVELAVIGGYLSVVGKGTFKKDDLVAYIPEDSIVPHEVLEELGLAGKLGGSKKNRVKAVRLRGVLSQGICYPARDGWEEGQDVTSELGIEKYEQPVPAGFEGKLFDARGKTRKYKIRNIKEDPSALEGLDVVMTEKIHGTFACFGLHLESDPVTGKQTVTEIAHSNGLGKKGLAFDLNDEENDRNLYVRAARQLGIFDRLRERFILEIADLRFKGDGVIPKIANTALHLATVLGPGSATFDALYPLLTKTEKRLTHSVYVMGEIYGRGVQDLHYGASVGDGQHIKFRVFDVWIGGEYCDYEDAIIECKAMRLDRVPELFRGKFSEKSLKEHTSGHETVSSQAKHLREGVVVKPLKNSYKDGERLIFKSISEEYLMRRKGTEYK